MLQKSQLTATSEQIIVRFRSYSKTKEYKFFMKANFANVEVKYLRDIFLLTYFDLCVTQRPWEQIPTRIIVNDLLTARMIYTTGGREMAIFPECTTYLLQPLPFCLSDMGLISDWSMHQQLFCSLMLSRPQKGKINSSKTKTMPFTTLAGMSLTRYDNSSCPSSIKNAGNNRWYITNTADADLVQSVTNDRQGKEFQVTRDILHVGVVLFWNSLQLIICRLKLQEEPPYRFESSSMHYYSPGIFLMVDLHRNTLSAFPTLFTAMETGVK